MRMNAPASRMEHFANTATAGRLFLLTQRLPLTGDTRSAACASADGEGRGRLRISVDSDGPSAPSAASASSRGAACEGVSAAASASGGVAAADAGAEEASLDSMMERLRVLQLKLKTGTAERADAAELDRLRQLYEETADGALRSRATARLATKERIVEMRGAVVTAARRKASGCRTCARQEVRTQSLAPDDQAV
jgi:hypothetical protein